MATEGKSMEPILEMIKTLTGINSPSGDTEEAIQFVEKYAKDLGYQTTLTNKGALLITVPGKMMKYNAVLLLMLIL